MSNPRDRQRSSREQRVGRYDLVARLAIGGMGELFLAREQGIEGFERLVAIKRILPGLSASAAFREMFLREARILARLNHPHVVQTVELGEDRGNYYLVLEYLRGSTLRELQVLADQAGAEFPPSVAVGIVIQGLRGLHAAHEMTDLHGNLLGTVHRDLSPHNLMCSPDGHVKLFDFGVAKSTEQGEQTHSGMLKGKFAYMSPEQCRQQPIDRRSDVFAVGIVLWELLAQQRLFKREAELDTMNAITTGAVPLLQKERPELPTELCEVVHIALALDPEDRWDSAAQLEEALTECARKTGMDISVAATARFVHEVAGERLASREKTLGAALERALTFQERLALIHTTGRPTDDDDLIAGEVEETIQVRPLSLPEAGPDPAPPAREARRRAPFLVAVTVGVAALALAAWLAARPTLSGPPVVLAWAPIQTQGLLRSEVQPLISYLEEELGRPVQLVVTRDYQESADKLVSGDASFAVLPPYVYVATKTREPRIRALTNQLFDGSKSADGLLLVKDDGGVQRIEDLRGTTFCFVDENSTTGALLPRAYLKSQGLKPREFIGSIHWSKSHQQVLRDVLDGRCAAGATYSGNLLTASEFGIASGQLRRLAITGTTPNETIAAGPGVDPTLAEELQRALLAFDPVRDAGSPYIGESQRITGFTLPEEAKFEFLRIGMTDD